MLTQSSPCQQCLRAQHYNAAIDWVLMYDIISADEQVRVKSVLAVAKVRRLRLLCASDHSSWLH